MAASYLDSPLLFKIRKVLRYLRLYGLSRTMAKVRGQLHMQRSESLDGPVWTNPACKDPEHADRIVAIVGCGGFAYSALAYYLSRRSSRFLRAALDAEEARARSLTSDFKGAYACRDIETILEDPQVRLVYIASNHASHAEYAIRCIEAGKHVHIEKPHVVTDDQLDRLMAASRLAPDIHVYLGFNRPKSRHFQRVREALDRETGPIMINWFVAGHEIPDDHWYFREEEGGRILGNLCHWSDLTLEMIGLSNAFPCTVVPASPKEAKSDFCVALNFADGSVAGITFSAKGHTFEGVREVLQAHRGNTMLKLRDFEETTIEVVEKKRRLKTLFRNHGHGANILDSYNGVLGGDRSRAVSPDYVEATARLFLAIKHAVDTQESIVVEPPATPV